MIIDGSASLVCLTYLGFFKDPAAIAEAARSTNVEIEGDIKALTIGCFLRTLN